MSVTGVDTISLYVEGGEKASSFAGLYRGVSVPHLSSAVASAGSSAAASSMSRPLAAASTATIVPVLLFVIAVNRYLAAGLSFGVVLKE